MRLSDKPLCASPHFLPAQGHSGNSHPAFSPSETFPTFFQTSLCSRTGQQLPPLPFAQHSTASFLHLHPSVFFPWGALAAGATPLPHVHAESNEQCPGATPVQGDVKTHQGRQGAKSGNIRWEKSNPGMRQPPDTMVFPYLERGKGSRPPRAMPPDRQMKGVV